jgi:hypothetical protein
VLNKCHTKKLEYTGRGYFHFTLSKQKHDVTNIFVWRSGLLVYNVIFIIGPNRLGAGLT